MNMDPNEEDVSLENEEGRSNSSNGKGQEIRSDAEDMKLGEKDENIGSLDDDDLYMSSEEDPEKYWIFSQVFPEDFYTDSPVHLEKLSDEEFKLRKIFLLKYIEENSIVDFQSPARRKCYGYYYGEEEILQEIAEHNAYWKQLQLGFLEKRENYSLGLPDPTSLGALTQKDLLAVFSKMHSRAFARSHRLCKSVNALLTSHHSKFCVRIRNGALDIQYGQRDRLHRLFKFSRDFDSGIDEIIEKSSIVPFTFRRIKGLRWTELDVFNQMKWPSLKLEMEVDHSDKWAVKPWMENQGVKLFDKGLVALQLVRSFKPRILYFYVNDPVLLEEVLASVERVRDLDDWTGGGVIGIIEKWKSGRDTYRTKKLSGYLSGNTDWANAVPECHTFGLGGANMSGHRRYYITFVPNLDNSYLVLFRESLRYTVLFDVRSLCDLIVHQKNMIIGRYPPINYSTYSGDVDGPLDPLALEQLLECYEPFQYVGPLICY